MSFKINLNLDGSGNSFYYLVLLSFIIYYSVKVKRLSHCSTIFKVFDESYL